jgi:hypothetical protein
MDTSCTIEDFKRGAKEFLEALPTLNADELENGLKCFNLLYLTCDLSEKVNEIVAVGLVRFVHKRVFDREFDLNRAALRA